jgi:hypothetical protein
MYNVHHSDRDIVVGLVTRYGLDGFGSNPDEGRFFAPVHTVPKTHPAFHTMGIGSFLEGKAAGAWRWPPHLASRLKMDLYSKTIQMHQVLKFILICSSTPHVSECLSVHHHESKTVHTASGICQTDPADCLLAATKWKCPPKNVECY